MKRAVAAIVFALIVLFFTTALGLSAIQLTGFPYTADIDYLKIPETAGISREEVLLNYNAIMDFLSPFSDKEFSLPTISYSERASTHFEECKPLFNAVYLFGAVSAVILIVLILLKAVPKKTLRLSGAVTLIIPAVIGAAVMIDFDSAFTFFHKIFFEGSTWIFDPVADSFILIMPSTFFMHCANFIALFWVVGAVTQFVIGYSKGKVRKF
ncbi:MAG: TIGR01906 family membrane protein [Firmicutes bacterium HGW-Firmicutes-16]|nr:MAG: TIGR01906 family membrane protein [Firmicutes bacterium HGW-Firmicutes-16]